MITTNEAIEILSVRAILAWRYKRRALAGRLTRMALMMRRAA